MQIKNETSSSFSQSVWLDCLVNLHGYSFLFINENSQLIGVLTGQQSHLLKLNELQGFTDAFMELEAKMNQKKIHILIIRAFERGKSNHSVLYDIGIRIILANLTKKLGITEIKEPKDYAVTGECKGNIAKDDLKTTSPIYLKDLEIYFNTKGTLSDQYKPIKHFISNNLLTEQELQEIVDNYQADKVKGLLNSKPLKLLKTYISKENWIFDKLWDIDVILNNPEREINHLTNVKDDNSGKTRCNFFQKITNVENNAGMEVLGEENSLANSN